MRIVAAGALLLAAACSGGGAPAGEDHPEIAEAAEGDTMIECALGAAGEFTRACAVHQVRADKGLELVVRHPDGGFRRFDVLTDGHGLAAADGAQPARIAVRDAGIEVRVGEDRYRFPATIADRAGN